MEMLVIVLARYLIQLVKHLQLPIISGLRIRSLYLMFLEEHYLQKMLQIILVALRIKALVILPSTVQVNSH